MKVFCAVLLMLTLAGGVAAGQRDKWRNYRHLDCTELTNSITQFQTHLFYLAYTEADAKTYHMYQKKLKELRKIKKGICWDI